VIAVEPVPAFAEILMTGVHLNEGFAKRLTLLRNVVYSRPGKYSVQVPINWDHRRTGPGWPHRKKMGMSSMRGEHGVVKGYAANWRNYYTNASSVRLDDLIDRDVCMLKVDVEGYEAQVVKTAEKLLRRRCVHALQVELTRTPVAESQNTATIWMVAKLIEFGYELREVNNTIIDNINATVPLAGRPWRRAPSLVTTLPRWAPGASKQQSWEQMTAVVKKAFWGSLTHRISTNLIAIRDCKAVTADIAFRPPLTG